MGARYRYILSSLPRLVTYLGLVRLPRGGAGGPVGVLHAKHGGKELGGGVLLAGDVRVLVETEDLWAGGGGVQPDDP
eukprot:4258172-Pyramimonas_sp.AAC.2